MTSLSPLPLWVVVAAAAAAGLAIGSFLNVVVYRVPRRLSVVRPPSFCPRCGVPVRPADNVPVLSWLLLGGRCRACSEPIAVRYPLVEAGTGLLFALMALAVGPHWAVPGFCAVAATMTTLVAVELDGLRPPPPVALVGALLGAALFLAAAVAGHLWAHLAGAGAGMAAGAVLAMLGAHAAAGEGADAGDEGTGQWGGAAWSLVPVGILLGWSGPVGAAAGIGALGVLVLLVPGARVPAPEAQPGGLRAAGIATAGALACVTAVVVAVAVGPALGH